MERNAERLRRNTSIVARPTWDPLCDPLAKKGKKGKSPLDYSSDFWRATLVQDMNAARYERGTSLITLRLVLLGGVSPQSL
jgi:hypothetical protein